MQVVMKIVIKLRNVFNLLIKKNKAENLHRSKRIRLEVDKAEKINVHSNHSIAVSFIIKTITYILQGYLYTVKIMFMISYHNIFSLFCQINLTL